LPGWLWRGGFAAVAVLLTCAGIPAALAQQPRAQDSPAVEAARYNQVDLSAQAEREVPNDVADAVLFAEVSDASAASAAAEVTRIANDALHVAQTNPAVRASSAGYSTTPVYTSSTSSTPAHIAAWRARAELRLQSREFAAMSDLIGKLQSTMQLSHVNFGVSPAARQQAENELITQAIGAFKARAELVREAIGGKTVRIRHMSVGTSGPVSPRPMFAAARASVSQPVQPEFEAGVSQVQVNVTGTVEID